MSSRSRLRVPTPDCSSTGSAQSWVWTRRRCARTRPRSTHPWVIRRQSCCVASTWRWDSGCPTAARGIDASPGPGSPTRCCSPRPALEPGVPINMRPWIERTTEDWIQQVRAAGYHVVGDLDELRTPVAAYDDELTEPSSASSSTPPSLHSRRSWCAAMSRWTLAERIGVGSRGWAMSAARAAARPGLVAAESGGRSRSRTDASRSGAGQVRVSDPRCGRLAAAGRSGGEPGRPRRRAGHEKKAPGSANAPAQRSPRSRAATASTATRRTTASTGGPRVRRVMPSRGGPVAVGDSFAYFALGNTRPLFADGTFLWTGHVPVTEIVGEIKRSDTVVIEIVQRSLAAYSLTTPAFRQAVARALGVPAGGGRAAAQSPARNLVDLHAAGPEPLGRERREGAGVGPGVVDEDPPNTSRVQVSRRGAGRMGDEPVVERQQRRLPVRDRDRVPSLRPELLLRTWEPRSTPRGVPVAPCRRPPATGDCRSRRGDRPGGRCSAGSSSRCRARPSGRGSASRSDLSHRGSPRYATDTAFAAGGGACRQALTLMATLAMTTAAPRVATAAKVRRSRTIAPATSATMTSTPRPARR